VWISNFKLIALLPAVGTGAISGAGLTSLGSLARFRAELSNETPMGSLPDQLAGRAFRAQPAGFNGSGRGLPRQLVAADKLLRKAEVQYVCDLPRYNLHGRPVRGSRRQFGCPQPI
jgi:hypothetical protein